MHVNICEIKAACPNPDETRERLMQHHPRVVGIDHQVDTYYKVSNGRLKLRQGDIENTLIYYDRADQAAPRPSDVTLYKPGETAALKEVLDAALEFLMVVDKTREIYFLDNVKIHLDTVTELGTFIEIEAIDDNGAFTPEELERQCRRCMELLGVSEKDCIAGSYSDLIISASIGKREF